MLIFEASMNVHVIVNLESGGVCAFASELQSLSPGEEEEDLADYVFGVNSSDVICGRC